jgi:hypothetical protein
VNGPTYWKAVGRLRLPSGQANDWYDRPSKSRSPFWYRSAKHWLASDQAVVVTPLTTTDLIPCGKQKASAYSQCDPLAGLLFGQATGPLGPCVVAFWHKPVVGLHGPSPVALGPSEPPLQVS